MDLWEYLPLDIRQEIKCVYYKRYIKDIAHSFLRRVNEIYIEEYFKNHYANNFVCECEWIKII